MTKKAGKWYLALTIAFFIVIIFFAANIPFFSIYKLPPLVNIDSETVEILNKEKYFGKFINAELLGDKNVSLNGQEHFKIKIKFLNLITLKTLNVNSENIDLIVGGDIVGFTLNGDGVIIIGGGEVLTSSGKIDTTINSDIKKGDIIKYLQDEKVESVADICKIVNDDKNKGKELKIVLKRKDKTINTTIKPELDLNSKIYKLGLWVKDDASGIGTLTYVRTDNNRFGSLGHAICDNDTHTPFNINSGNLYYGTLIGLKKGSKGKAGELKGLFLQGKDSLGSVDKNCSYGVFGEINEKNLKIPETAMLKQKAGGRLYAKPGKAFIRTTIDNNGAKDFEIEIVKTNYQSFSNEKSMVIRVTDKQLLEKTGGIIQGMSGSPIIQNGRVIGAVTHVFINDPAKGFGIYLDWMINQ